VELSKNYGQSLALAAGFDIAKGDYIITLDGDLQNDPNDILPMLNKAVEGDWDIVTGIRVKRKDSIIKTIPSRIANFIIRTLTRLNISDQGCALKVFKKETAKSLNLYGEMHRFINLAAYLDGARITEVPVRHNPRKFGYSKYGLGRIFKVINDLLLILFQKKFLQKPIYFFGSIGIIIFSTGSILSLYFFVIRIMGQDIWGRPLLILSIMLVIIGIQIFSIGITYDLMMKTYYESQNKKPYKIRKIHQSD
jgi:glycosyltransferase involved in cell wall biosynthesis